MTLTRASACTPWWRRRCWPRSRSSESETWMEGGLDGVAPAGGVGDVSLEASEDQLGSGSSPERLAALGAELRRAVGLGAAVDALLLLVDRRAALGAEPTALGLGSALGTLDGDHLRQVAL